MRVGEEDDYKGMVSDVEGVRSLGGRVTLSSMRDAICVCAAVVVVVVVALMVAMGVVVLVVGVGVVVLVIVVRVLRVSFVIRFFSLVESISSSILYLKFYSFFKRIINYNNTIIKFSWKRSYYFNLLKIIYFFLFYNEFCKLNHL